MTDPEAVGMCPRRLARIKPRLQAYVDDGEIAGLSTMIARRGEIVHFEQVGWMDVEAQVPLSEDTLFRIYSMTKPIVCTALMTLYEKGRFHLYDPVSKYIPAFKTLKVLKRDASDNTRTVDLAREITVRDLLTHTAGLTYDFLENSPVSALYREARLVNNAGRTLEELIAELVRLPLAYQPGTRWHYSLGIDVAAHLVEILSDPARVVDSDCFPPRRDARIKEVHPTKAYFVSWMARILSLKNAWSRKP